MPSTHQLFEEFAAAYDRGERPSRADYVARASGPDRLALDLMIDRYISKFPEPETFDADAFAAFIQTPEMRQAAAIAAEGLPTWATSLRDLFARAGVGRRPAAKALAAELDLTGAETLVDEALHEMQQGWISERQVDDRVLAPLATLLETTVEHLRAAGRAALPRPATGTASFARTAAPHTRSLPATPASPGVPDPEREQLRARVNELFRGEPS